MPDRPPLDAARLRSQLAPPWTELRLVEETGSTNADLLAAAGDTPAGTVLVAERQTAGRGRLDRHWSAPAGASLTFSALLRPPVPTAAWGWLPLLAGVALCEAVLETTGADVVLKWPNDLLAGPWRRKAAGILVQVAGDAAVVGIGLNVTTTDAELDLPTATSLAAQYGARLPDRTELLAAVLAGLGRRYRDWVAAGGDAAACGLADDYRAHCVTVGLEVVVTGARGRLRGVATGIDGDGRLLLRTGAAEQAIAAGDIEHLRLADG